MVVVNIGKMDLHKALSTLEMKSCSPEEKQRVYTDINGLQKSGKWDFDEGSNKLITFCCQDITAYQNELIVSKAVSVLLFCVRHEKIGSNIQKNASISILKALFHCCDKTSSADVLENILSCLTAQNWKYDLGFSEIPLYIQCLSNVGLKLKMMPSSSIEEYLELFMRLENHQGLNIREHVAILARPIVLGVCHALPAVREKCNQRLEVYKAQLIKSPEFSKLMVKTVSSGLSQGLKALLPTYEDFALKTWALIVEIIGKELHKGSSINQLLEVVELGFKGNPTSRQHSFVAWRSLIDNFALDQGVISDPKRIKLVMMVLKIDNAKTEEVAIEKLKTWWYFLTQIGPKLSGIFEQVGYPLLQFCVGNGKLQAGAYPHGQGQRSGLKIIMTPNTPSSLRSGTGKNQLPVLPVLQKLGCEVLAHLLWRPAKTETAKFTHTLETLPNEVFQNSSTFVKHASFLMMSVLELFRAVGTQIEESLVLSIWTNIANHMRAALDSPAKTECRDVYSSFLSHFHTMIQEQVFKGPLLMKMLQLSCNFPQKVLASTAYNLTGGKTIRGCPALLLIEMLLTPVLIYEADDNENYIKLFSMLAAAGASNSQGALAFLQAVIDSLETNASSFASVDLLWRLWSTVVHTLQENIGLTNEVNQGDALDHNFGCLNAVLLFPIKLKLSSQLSQAVNKVLVRTWRDLYHTFARLAALVATAEANTCVEELSAKIMAVWAPGFKNPLNLEFLSYVSQKMADCLDFSSLSTNSVSSGLTLSPSKWARRRQRPMGNLHSFVHLLVKIQLEINEHLMGLAEGFPQNQDGEFLSTTLTIHSLVEVYTRLFTHVSTAGLILHILACLAGPMALLFQSNLKTGSLKLFVPSFMAKLEKLWMEVSHCVSGRYTGQYDSELLEYLSPLLEATFCHSRRAIKTQALSLWSSTFSRTTSLTYPDSLKPVLTRVKEKSTIILPGWITNEHAVIAETPFSEMSLGESLPPAPELPGVPSPKHKTSFLHRDISPRPHSPKPSVSPAKVVSPKEAKKLFSSARKHLDVDFMPKEEFVVIRSPSQTKKRVLTEHQKEMMKERSVLPAMYNSLEISQDVSLPSQFASETQQSSSGTDVIVINSSESQNIASKPLSSESSHGVEESGDVSSFAQPSKCVGRRRSVRIKEQKDSDSISHPISPTKGVQKEDLLTSEGPEHSMEFVESSIDQDISKMKSLRSKVGKAKCNQKEGECSGNEESPFGMFRKKSQSPPLGSGDDGISLSQDSGHARSRRASSAGLRKVRSEDNFQAADCSDKSSPSSGSLQVKAPRRVALKKVSDDLHSDDDKCSSLRKTRSITSTSKITVLNMDSWVIKKASSNSGKTKSPDEPDLKCAPKETHGLLAGANENCMLVEDTQSPTKLLGKTVSSLPEKSIAETPIKSDDSSSPGVKSHSARKLFVEDESQPDVGTGDVSLCPTEKEGSDSQESRVPEMEEAGLSSSQGFETSVKEASGEESKKHTMFGFSQLDSQDVDKNVTALTENSEEISKTEEKENSHVLLQSASEAGEDYSPEMMPTLASPSKTVPVPSSDSSKCSTSETKSSTSSSEQSELDLSQPTLKVDNGRSTPNKRKRALPKKYSPVKRPRRASRGPNEKKACPCCPPSHSCSSKNGQADSAPSKATAKSDSKPELTLIKGSPVGHPNSNPDKPKQQSEILDAKVEKEASPDQTSPDKNSSHEESSKLLNNEISPEVGEVTPDMKSPSSSLPKQRTSTTRKKRQVAKRLSERLASNMSRKGGDDVSVSDDSQDSFNSSSTPVADIDGGESSKDVQEKNSSSSEVKTRRVLKRKLKKSPTQSKITSVSPKRHLLRMRTKAVRCLTPSPEESSLSKKSRKMDIEEVNDASKVDAQNNSIPEQNPGKNMEEGDTDDIPLSRLLNKETKIKAGEPEVVAQAWDALASEVTEMEESLVNAILAKEEDTKKEKSSASKNEEITERAKAEITTEEHMEAIEPQNAGADYEQEQEALEQKDKEESESCLNITVSESDTCEPNKSEVKDVIPASMEDCSPELQCGQIQQDARTETPEDITSEDRVIIHDSDILCVEVEVGQSTGSAPSSEEHIDLNNCKTEDSEHANEEHSENGSDENLFTEEDSPSESEGTEDCEMEDAAELVKGVSMEQTSSEESTPSDDVFEPGNSTKGTENQEDIQQQAEAEAVMQTSVTGESTSSDEAGAKTHNGEEDGSKSVSAASEFVPSDWSPSRSPSVSILKKGLPVSPTSSATVRGRRVSFAEPVVSGESPVREKYHSESLLYSPKMSQTSSPGRKCVRSRGGRSYRRQLEGSLRKESTSTPRPRLSPALSSSPSPYRATQESQLDNTKPICPQLMGCTTSIDIILPQLTSSLWYRGLIQLMKSRSLLTIGDLSALTEVQVNQMPIRHPKVDTVRNILSNYLNQHADKYAAKSQDAVVPVSKGATLYQEVTPSNIADEGVKLLPSVERDLKECSPIKAPNCVPVPKKLRLDEIIDGNIHSYCAPHSRWPSNEESACKDSALTRGRGKVSQCVNDKESSNSSGDEGAAQVTDTAGSQNQNVEDGKKNEAEAGCTSKVAGVKDGQRDLLACLSELARKAPMSQLKQAKTAQLFDIHQNLTILFGAVVEEMKSRQPSS